MVPGNLLPALLKMFDAGAKAPAALLLRPLVPRRAARADLAGIRVPALSNEQPDQHAVLLEHLDPHDIYG